MLYKNTPVIIEGSHNREGSINKDFVSKLLYLLITVSKNPLEEMEQPS